MSADGWITLIFLLEFLNLLKNLSVKKLVNADLYYKICMKDNEHHHIPHM